MKPSKHTVITKLGYFHPMLGHGVFYGNGCKFTGEVFIASRCEIGNNTTINGEMNWVDIGEYTYIGHNCSISSLHWILDSDEIGTVNIGDKVIIEPNVSINACTI